MPILSEETQFTSSISGNQQFTANISAEAVGLHIGGYAVTWINVLSADNGDILDQQLQVQVFNAGGQATSGIVGLSNDANYLIISQDIAVLTSRP